MLKAKCLECSNGKATFYFEGKTPKINEYYHLEERTGKSLELNGLFHALVEQLFIWMFNQDKYIFNDGGIDYDLRASNKHKLKDVLKQQYGEGNYYQYSACNHAIVKEKDFNNIPLDVLNDFNDGNTNRIKLVLKSWGKYTPNQAQKLVDITLGLMGKLGVSTPKYDEIMKYLDKKELDRINEQNKQYTDKVKDKFNGTIEG